MSSFAAFSHPQIDLLPEQGAANDEIRTQVWGLLSTLYPKVAVMERRREIRYPFPFLVHLTPVGEDGATPCGESVVVVGKHISERGPGLLSSPAAALSPHDRLAGRTARRLVRVPHRPDLVPLHAARLVRERGPLPRIGHLAV